MQIKALIPLTIPLFLSLIQPCPAPIGQAISLGVRVGSKLVHAGNDVADHVSNNSRRTDPGIFIREANNGNGNGNGNGKNRGTGNGTGNKNGNQNGNHDSGDDNDDVLAGLPQPAANICKQQLTNREVRFHVNNNNVKVDGVPPACMTLATVFLGDNPDGGAPVPLGKLFSSVLDRRDGC